MEVKGIIIGPKQVGSRDSLSDSFNITVPALIEFDHIYFFAHGHASTLVACHETYHPDPTCERLGGPVQQASHTHVAWRSIVKWRLADLYERMVEPCFGPCHLERTRSWKSIVRYITKEDLGAFRFNVPLSQCSFAYHLAYRARRAEFSYGDGFVMDHLNVHHGLRASWDAVRNPSNRILCPLVLNPLYVLPESVNNNPYIVPVFEWFRSVIARSFTIKRPALYLYGPPNTGKSTTVGELLRDYAEESAVFRPARGTIFWLDGITCSHSVILIDEFDIGDYPFNDLKMLMEGRETVCQRKSRPHTTVKFEGVFIIVSNNDMPSSVLFPGFAERVRQVYTGNDV